MHFVAINENKYNILSLKCKLGTFYLYCKLNNQILQLILKITNAVILCSVSSFQDIGERAKEASYLSIWFISAPGEKYG